MSFSENLKKLRKENKLTQEALAEKLDVSRQAVSKWESDTGYPEMDKLILIAKIFNVSVDWLLETELGRQEAVPKKTNESMKSLIEKLDEVWRRSKQKQRNA